MIDTVKIRVATVADAEALARLKIHWAQPAEAPSPADTAAFIGELADWMTRMGDRLVCRVADSSEGVVGMAWMVIFDRVPDFGNAHRVSADVQSVFVDPEYRYQGVGARLLEAINTAADQRGIPRVLVHSSSRAIPFYNRHGFQPLVRLLARIPAVSEPAH